MDLYRWTRPNQLWYWLLWPYMSVSNLGPVSWFYIGISIGGETLSQTSLSMKIANILLCFDWTKSPKKMCEWEWSVLMMWPSTTWYCIQHNNDKGITSFWTYAKHSISHISQVHGQAMRFYHRYMGENWSCLNIIHFATQEICTCFTLCFSLL